MVAFSSRHFRSGLKNLKNRNVRRTLIVSDPEPHLLVKAVHKPSARATVLEDQESSASRIRATTRLVCSSQQRKCSFINRVTHDDAFFVQSPPHTHTLPHPRHARRFSDLTASRCFLFTFSVFWHRITRHFALSRTVMCSICSPPFCA